MIMHTVKPRYREAKLLAAEGQPKQRQLISALIDTKDDLIIIGDIGTGKTHLVSAYINLAVAQGIYAKYITEYDFTDLFTMRHSKDAQAAKDANNSIFHCKHYRVLVIDEVGKRELTKNQNVELDELISARYDNMLRTIIVANLTAEEVKKRVKDRAYDRLKGNNAQVIVLDGKSLRGTQ